VDRVGCDGAEEVSFCLDKGMEVCKVRSVVLALGVVRWGELQAVAMG
jgi:hypothetical protein